MGKNKKIVCIIIMLMFVYFGTAFSLRHMYLQKYEKAVEYFNNGDYSQASTIFEKLGNYKNSIYYLELGSAIQLYKGQDYINAASAFLELNKYIDCSDWLIKSAERLIENGQIKYAIDLFEAAGDKENQQKYTQMLSDFNATAYDHACELFDQEDYQDAWLLFTMLEDYKDSLAFAKKCEDIIKRIELSNPISAGAKTVLGITNNKIVVSSGDVSLFDFSEWNDIVSVSVGNVIAIGLKLDGTAITTGRIDGSSIKVDDWNDIVAVSAGERFVVGLKKDGSVVSQGHNGDHQRDLQDWKDYTMVAIDTGWRHTVGLDENGKIHIAGYGKNQLEKQIENKKSDWDDVIDIATGGGGTSRIGHIVGLKEDGTVVAVGDNTYGQCNTNTDEWHDIIAISAGEWHTVGLRADGTVVSTKPSEGAIDYNRNPLFTQCCDVNQWKNIVAISAGSGTTVGLKKDGTVVALGYNDFGQRNGAQTWSDIKIYSLSQQGDSSFS